MACAGTFGAGPGDSAAAPRADGEDPSSQVTEFGNVVVMARVGSRSVKSALNVDDSANATKQAISRAECERAAAEQDAFIAAADMVVLDCCLGSDPDFRAKARLIIETANANTAGMQQQHHPRAQLGLLR
jgi:ATP-dependent phosphoenolpyruvate carboxykinase